MTQAELRLERTRLLRLKCGPASLADIHVLLTAILLCVWGYFSRTTYSDSVSTNIVME